MPAAAWKFQWLRPVKPAPWNRISPCGVKLGRLVTMLTPPPGAVWRKGRRRALQHLDLLEREGIEARPRPLAARGQAQPVDEIVVGREAARAEAAHAHLVHAAVDARRLGLDAGGVGQRVGDRRRGAQVDLLAADDRDRLRRCDDRRVVGGRGGRGPTGRGDDDLLPGGLFGVHAVRGGASCPEERRQGTGKQIVPSVSSQGRSPRMAPFRSLRASPKAISNQEQVRGCRVDAAERLSKPFLLI